MAADRGEEAADYRLEVHDHPARLDAAEWNALLALAPQPTPFLKHEYLLALHESGSATPATGWTPQFMALCCGNALAAVAPGYLKTHSRGEYVFDWAWADAYARHGLAYYPKLLSAVPFTPVPGSRWLARDAYARQALARGLQQLADQQGLSSVHALFLDDADVAAARAEGWLLRTGVQFHWTQRAGTPYADLSDFLASLQRDKRKKIQQERRKVRDAGVSFEVVEGQAITEAQWDFFHHCYTLTYRAHGGEPYLTRDFFRRMAQNMPQHWLLFIAMRGGESVASSLLAIDRSQRVAWGRYWGATQEIDCLHFEACYYQPLDWCIAQGFERFEGGAQGEHKMARGLMPVATTSAHWLAHPEFSRAVEDFLAREGAGISAYVSELNEHSPFRSDQV
ncbi:MAG: N-acetyltransferase [Vitreoscilla sp.]|nr:N-acetyltransferase [Vitreoscilla sp.]MBP6673855.1 N-acetyltransferase [Vitreoscilla sp.]